MKRFVRTAKVAALALMSAVLISCGGEAADERTLSESALPIKGAGATFPEPLYQSWIARYEEGHPDVDFSYESVGSGAGIKRFIAEKVDFGASDAAMKDDEIAQVERGVKLIPVTAGMVVLAYNLPGVAGELKLPRDVYVDIFLGKLSRWDDPRIVAANPRLNLPALPIQPKVKISYGSIGYMKYGFARRLGLPVATLQNRAGALVRPDADSGRAALAAAAAKGLPSDLRLFLPDPEGPESYPIVSLSWILLYGRYDEPEKAAALKECHDLGPDRRSAHRPRDGLYSASQDDRIKGGRSRSGHPLAKSLQQ